MVYVDLSFYLSVAAIGLGLSLVTYRMFARRYDWPMGAWQAGHHWIPVLIGLGSMVVGILFAAGRWNEGAVYAAGAIVVFALALAIFWIGFLRVASQASLILAPACAGLLFVAWNFGASALEYHTVRSEIRELRQQLQDQFGLKKGTEAPRRAP